jgi:Cytochrome b(N-terminal)/b6/petB
MAAWRGKRAWTWITGVVAFAASVVECFTGYVSQSNFDSQWISASAKDAFNSVGVSAFFNVMNFGQMLLWHVVLVPIVLVAIIGAHVLLVRVRGVSHPLPAHLGIPGSGSRRQRRRAMAAVGAAPWRGPTRRSRPLSPPTWLRQQRSSWHGQTPTSPRSPMSGSPAVTPSCPRPPTGPSRSCSPAN